MTDPASPPVKLNWAQVRGYRLQKHHLDERAPKRDLVRVVGDVCGVQSQLASAAELAVWARVEGVQKGDVNDCLWNQRTLVRTWMMRGTLHLLPSDQLSTYTSVQARTRGDYSRGELGKVYGLTGDEIEKMIAIIGSALEKDCLTREELADIVSSKLGAHLRKGMLSGWGQFLKPAAYNGKLIAGPPKNGRQTFVGPDHWLKKNLRREDFEKSLRTILRNYLAAYGPVTHQEFGLWWSLILRSTRKLFMSIGDEITPVDVEGYRSWILTRDLDQIKELSLVHSVRLLPSFDDYVLHFRPRNMLIPEKYIPRVFRPQGWISPVVLVDGRAVGTWEIRKGKGNELRAELFGRLTREQKDGLRDEAEGLGRFLGRSFSLTFRSLGSLSNNAR